jgi:bifunctional non-homologous end joining protein LigD
MVVPKASLSTYRRKRDFAKSSEPPGLDSTGSSKHLRYVIQKHDARRLHYDLRLEWNGVFKSWAVTKGPSVDPADKRLAVEVEDHPLDYGDFEGTIPQGQYGGGTVQLWDRGYWTPEGKVSAGTAMKAGELKFTLEGKRLHGSWVLVRMKHDRYQARRNNWLLIKHKDSAAQSGGTPELLQQDKSVATGRSMAQIAVSGATPPERRKIRTTPRVKAISQFIEPQLCKLVDRPPLASGWVHEVKIDGYRAQLHVNHGVARIYTRRGLDWTRRFSAIAKAARELPDCVIDGEIVAFDRHGTPSFAALQAALAAGATNNLTLFAFDLLIAAHQDLRRLELRERKRRLEEMLDAAAMGARVRYVRHFESRADTLLLSACKAELEGIVSKRIDAPYESGRGGSWTKTKCRSGQEVVLGAWTLTSGRLRSLLAGVYRDGQLHYVGRIGTGYGRQVIAELLPKLKASTRTKSPFAPGYAPPEAPGIRWLKPTLVAEIKFAGWTASGMIRQGSFKGLRQDKAARAVVAEKPSAATALSPAQGHAAAISVMGVSISKPDKPLWPDAQDGKVVTKLDLANYYAEVGAWMLPHLNGRPCSLVRAPDGVGGSQFFQRHAMPGLSKLFDYVKVRGDRAAYIQIDRIETLAAVAQMAALEIHPWNCAPNKPEVAGRLVFDLDPAPDVNFDSVIATALELRDRLKAIGLESFCKSTGGKGLHVITPLRAQDAIKWSVANQFARVICAQMVQDSPTRYVDNMAKSARVGKIFLDYLRNDRTATAVAVLSTRARAGAPVSMPVDWSVVRRRWDPSKYTLRTAPIELRKAKPWIDYASAARSLTPAIRKLIEPRSSRKR